jgi:hypothetical protein
MRKFAFALLAVFLLFSMIGADQSTSSQELSGISQIWWSGGRSTEAMVMGSDIHCECNVASGNATPSFTNCRALYCDVSGIIKISYRSDDDGNTHTEVLYVNAGSPLPFRNIITVYQYYVGTTPCTAQIYTSAGALVVGIKLRK